MWMNFDSPNFPSFCSLSAIISFQTCSNKCILYVLSFHKYIKIKYKMVNMYGVFRNYSAKFVPLKYYTLSSQLRRLTSFSVGCSGRRILSPGQIAVMRKWSIGYFISKIISLLCKGIKGEFQNYRSDASKVTPHFDLKYFWNLGWELTRIWANFWNFVNRSQTCFKRDTTYFSRLSFCFWKPQFVFIRLKIIFNRPNFVFDRP